MSNMEYIKKFDEFTEDQNYETIDELLQTVYTSDEHHLR